LTRDENVHFLRGPELRELVATALAGYEKVVGARVPPHRNNLLLALRGPAAAEHIGVGREAIDVPGVDH
jgi:hypothetical protein